MNEIGGGALAPECNNKPGRKIGLILIRMESEEPRLTLYYGVGSYLVIGAPLEEPPA